MNARAELSGIILSHFAPDPHGGSWRLDPGAAADDVIGAGYTKPRTITTIEELVALRNGAAILDSDGDVAQKIAGQWCGYETGPLTDRSVSAFLPATVLYEPAS